MKKRRFKKKRVKQDTSQEVTVFNEVDIPPSPAPIKSTIYCLFCYKLSSIDNNGESQSQTEKLTACHRFYKNVTNEKFPFVEEAYGTKCGVCDDCYYVVDNHCKLHFEVECLQLRLRWQLYKLFRVMKYAGRVPSRVKLFKESLVTEKMTNGDSICLEGVLDFRQKLYEKSSRRLKNRKPRVLLSSPTAIKPKVRSSKETKNKISQGTQTLVEFSDTACNTSEVGNVGTDRKGSKDGSQSQLKTEKADKNAIEGCQKNNSKICSVCGIRFKKRRNLNLHMKSHRENAEDKTEKSNNKLAISKCKVCLGGFADEKKLKSHKYGQFCTKVDENASTVIVSEEEKLRNWRFKGECPECGIIFKERTEEQLNTLIKLHLELSEIHARIVDSWIHVCQFCGIRFQYQCHYKTHLALHETNELVDDTISERQGVPRILDVKSLIGRRRPDRPSHHNQGTTSQVTTGRRPVGRPRLNRPKNPEAIPEDKSGRRPVGRPSLNRRNNLKKRGKTLAMSMASKQRVQSLLRDRLLSKSPGVKSNYKFCCLTCDRKYPGETHLRIHLQSNIHNSKAKRTNLAKQILKCNKCPGAFLSQVTLKDHKKKFCKKFGKVGNNTSQKLDFNYVCNLCSMYFQDKAHLRKHTKLHKADPDSNRKDTSKHDNDEMDTYDEMTGADGDIEIELNNAEHDVGEVSTQPTNPLFKCIICNELFSSEEILVEHAKTKHWPLATSDPEANANPKATKSNFVIERQDGAINIKTNRCSQGESRKLRQPDNFTGPHPTFVCIVCKKPYYSLNGLNSHMMVAHDIIIRPVDPPPVVNVPTKQAPSNDDDDDIVIIENETEDVVEEEQEIQIEMCVLSSEKNVSKDDVDPLEAPEEPRTKPSEGPGHGKKLMEMKCQVCSKTFMGWSKSYLLATLKEHSEQHPGSVTTPKPAEELQQDNSSVPIPLISIDDLADENDNMDVEDAGSSEDIIEVRKSSHNPSYAFEGECPKCGKLFYGRNAANTKQYVQRHLRSKLHGGAGNNYKSCDNCGKRFRTRALLEEHELTACEREDNDDGDIVGDDDDLGIGGRGPGNQLVLREIFKCCHCSKTFSTQEKLASHEGARQCFNENDESDNDGGGGDVDDGDAVEIEESNPQEIELSSDSEYSPEFENSATRRNQLTQVETEIFKCPIENCNTFFTSHDELNGHLAIHVDFACAFCDFRTKNPYDLIHHENTLHTYYVAEKNLKCSRCPEIFDLSGNVDSHRFHFLHDHLGIESE